MESCFPARFDPRLRCWVPTPDSGYPEISGLTSLRLVTFNVWFGEHYQHQRYSALFEILRACRADVIGLQETIPELLDSLLEQDWVREEYFCSDLLGATIDPYGVILLSRLPFRHLTLHHLPSQMNRKLLVAEYSIHGQSFQVGVAHLESLRMSSLTRGQQLEVIFPQLRKSDHAVFMGDCNFCSSWQDENDRIDESFHDLWPTLRPQEMGYTEDTDINRMRFDLKGKAKQVRFDRIFLRSPTATWLPKHIEMLGTESLAPTLPDVWPSDHFGLLAELSWDGR